jgi:hypothetical protein
MQLEKSVTVYATEKARKKWEGKEWPKRCSKSGCPSCDLGRIKKEREQIKDSREE